ncbi:YARHG domain-containing protein [Jiella avicenniae]|uniref:YARHG domain-containing protein n=1 Tax=Jiella avicenniae TaxID=2907202 RepID=A0A9X1P0J6_9HYPH|nr:YARHG domain-containing protein [Jiella avicenniae]MCE7027644.1 YARHG domain-containing protein [Jiella avicenniae]MCE7028686.1 YARHG domain-containing protein [Jiella avicenniae]
MTELIARILFLTFLCGSLLLPSPALAAPQYELWELQILTNLQGLQINRQCVPNGGAQHIHILGVSSDDTLLSPVEKTAILSDLSELISTRTNARTTKADNFQSIATSYSGFSESASREIDQLVESASSADITVLVRPFRDNGASVDTEIRLWARGAGGADPGLNCVQSFSVEIPTKKEDPACAAAFAKSRRDNDPARLEAFRDFFPQCPQAAEADGLVTALRASEAQKADRERCERNFARARAEGSVAAYSAYLDENIDCPGRDVVMALRDQAAEGAACETAYRDARRLDTLEAYERFMLENRACPQADTASAFLTMKRQEAERAKVAEEERAKAGTERQKAQDDSRQAVMVPNYSAPPSYDQPPASNPPAYVPPASAGATYRGYPIPPDLAASTCGQLWYARNLLFDLAGYCFKSAKAQRYFSNAGCTGASPRGSDAAEVSRLQALERQNGC